MIGKSLEESKKFLQERDLRTLEYRAQRFKELSVIETSFSTQKEWDYTSEADSSYIEGNYRSTIFCCACAVDQIFRYEYLKIPGNRNEKLRKLSFGQIIDNCQKIRIPRLVLHIEKAGLLNNIRNNVATHPLFLDIPAESDPERKIAKELLLNDVRTLLVLVGRIDPNLKSEIESNKLIDKVEGKTYILLDLINQKSEVPNSLHGFWGLIEKQILAFLALQSWKILKEISEALYPVKNYSPPSLS